MNHTGKGNTPLHEDRTITANVHPALIALNKLFRDEIDGKVTVIFIHGIPVLTKIIQGKFGENGREINLLEGIK